MRSNDIIWGLLFIVLATFLYQQGIILLAQWFFLGGLFGIIYGLLKGRELTELEKLQTEREKLQIEELKRKLKE
ncbi:MAG: hypothetical protein WA102_04250 [Candidatus Methanoperedens sp.]